MRPPTRLQLFWGWDEARCVGLLGSAPGSAGCRGQVPKSTRGRRRQSFPGPQASPLSFPLLISPPRSGGEQ